MRLSQFLRGGVAAACLASAAWPASALAPEAASAPRGSLDVRVAQADAFSRVEFHWAGQARMTSRREGRVLTLVFNRDADPDISRLRTAPPKWIETAEKRRVGGHLEVAVTLADDADVRVGTSDGASWINVFQKAAPDPAQIAEAKPVEAEPVRANPVPASGVVRMDAQVAGGQGSLSFTWANPAGAAVFRRGDDVWVVFDAAANLDVSKAPRGLKQFGDIATFKGADYSALRIKAPRGVPVFATSEGATWTIAFGPGAQNQPTTVRLARDGSSGPALLQAAVAGATRIVRIKDPEAGDTLDVVTALGPPKGLPSRRDYVQMAFLPSVQGLAVESKVDDLTFSREGDLVRIGRGAGLTLSPAWAAREQAQSAMGSPSAAAMPGLVDETWSKVGEGGFLARYNSLLTAASNEAQDRQGPTEARMALARFLVGSELSFEAIGVLNDSARARPELLENPEFRGLRGVARVMARRYKEAETDFSSPVLADDPSSALWRSHIAVQLAQWTEARAQFGRGVEAFAQFSPAWKARFARGDAQAALALGDVAGADARIRLALMDKTDALEECATRLVQARVIEAQGHKDRALRMYLALAGAPAESLSAPAQLRATQIRLETGKISQNDAAKVFDGLRYRWRGDATELETIRALGQLYLGQGRYREALEALRSAGARLPDLPQAMQLSADLTSAFRTLFLDGLADGLEPVQALALFYDFKDLTPVGSDGDLMVRKMVRRLVDVDLLSQAEELLKYQIDNRLDGVPKAQVATDLATIYLMDRKPEQALQTINNSRTTALPRALMDTRRVLEARGWAGVGRYDSALEILDKDVSPEANDLRAEISWKKKDWAAAGPLFEKQLGERWKNAAPLSSEDEGKLLRAGVAYSLASDEAALSRLDQRYSAFYEQAHNPEALRIALSGEPSGHLGVSDFSRVSADSEAFSGWVAKMKKRLRAAASPTGGPTTTAAAAPPTAKPAAPAGKSGAPAKQAQAASPKAAG
jgi:tetratricopeptide (TPR) repeat protein